VSQSNPSSTQWMSPDLLLPYLSVSLSVNVLVCTLTVLRLMYHRACISKAFGPEYGVLYTSIASMMIESAVVYAIGSLLYLISYGANSPLDNAFCQILGEAQVSCDCFIHLFIQVVVTDLGWFPEFVPHTTRPSLRFLSSIEFPRARPGRETFPGVLRPPTLLSYGGWIPRLRTSLRRL
jgi:hypothetical protein